MNLILTPNMRIVFPDEVHFTKGERLNIAPSGKSFICDFIEAGVVSYTDLGAGYELLRKETIMEALNSFVGCPLIERHVTTLKPVPTDRIAGTIAKVGFNPDNGWFWCGGRIEGPRENGARDEISKGMPPSCGYTALEFGPGGTYHGVPYQREITRIKFHHLAIVPRARYEDAEIRLNGRKTSTGDIAMPSLKWLKKLIGKDAEGKETVTSETGDLPADATLEVQPGKTVRLNELVLLHEAEEARLAKEAKDKTDAETARTNAAAAAAAPAAKPGDRSNAIGAEDELEVKPGVTVKVSALLALHNAAEERKNAAAEAAKTGVKHYTVLAGARDSAAAKPVERLNSADTLDQKVARGAERYGSTQKN